jgi:hypothetical protein
MMRPALLSDTAKSAGRLAPSLARDRVPHAVAGSKTHHHSEQYPEHVIYPTGSCELKNKYGKHPPLRSTEKSRPDTTAPRFLQNQTIVSIADVFERDLSRVQLGLLHRRTIGER